jgi:hypothetical protein
MVLLLSAAPEPERSNEVVLSVPVLSLAASGASLQVERYVVGTDWSLAATLGLHVIAAGDYGSLRLSAGSEVRRWFHLGPLSSSGVGALGGPFAWGRADVAWTRLERAGRGMIGAAAVMSQSTGLGYRILPWWRLELTASAGIGVAEAFSPSSVRVTAVFGLTVGCVL